MIKYIVASLLLFASSAFAQNVNTLDPTQVYTTTNIVNNTTSPTDTTGTWQNLGLVNQGLPCWGPGGPVYCGPLPYYNNGSFNFSYGLTDVYQVANIAAALPNSGTGLRVNGYNFTFMAKNGNGWDNGQQDYLSAYVNFYGSDGKLARNDYYDLNYKFDWTFFGYSKTFDTPYASKDLSTVQYGFVGGDSNFWAGPYGPEVYNVGFSLKYSVDPCYINKLSSTSCPGYMEELNKLTSVAVIETTPTIAQTTTESTSTPAITTTVTQTASTSTEPKASTQTASTTSENKNTAGPSLQSALSMIQSNQAREQRIAMTAVAQSNEVAQSALAQAEQTAVAVATTSMSQSLDVARESAKSETKDTKNNNNQSQFSLLSTQSNTMQQMPGLSIQFNPLLNPSNSQQATTSLSQPMMLAKPDSSTPVNTTTSAQENLVSQQTQLSNNLPVTQPTELTTTNALFGKRGDPVTDNIEQNSIMVSMAQPETKPSTINKNASDNDVAGGVRIERMAVVPTGYNAYTNYMLKDVAFYAPKEIYRNQKNVDNVRVLRQLSSDRLHQEMVDQQYRR